jgi:hypothetical protein
MTGRPAWISLRELSGERQQFTDACVRPVGPSGLLEDWRTRLKFGRPCARAHMPEAAGPLTSL